MFQYSDKDFIFTTSWKSLDGQSKFDEKLRNLWREKEDQELFRYKYNIECSIELPGKYGFLAVLNTDRGTKRRKPITFCNVLEPFNDDLFNFTKVNPGEYLFKFSYISNNSSNPNDILAINASPLGDFHSLILPKLTSKLPQVINEYSLNVAIQLLLQSASPALRVGFNSLCAFASVNHLHLHLYYLFHRMYLEYCDLVKLSGPCHTILDFPSKGFVFILNSKDSLPNFVK
ncbi:GDP-D-glucose phosphorylase 1 [Sipha flava]|uniref:GDP-D-glucose phosphorylase 1 n=1 Tax=Sipha flava TaxID=143950 RepID=A0A8B8GHR6_9HEMI|nr:GDP-D-glucose phosphorylase 1 [Sipha flava]